MAPTAGQFATRRAAIARLRRQVPAGAARVLETLGSAGACSYLVGGAVRDAFLGRPITDWDIATDLEPRRVARLFPRVVLAGVEHGTVMVLTRTGPVEVTTFRGDGPYCDGRRPSHVTFHTDLEADLARRDFTINAMAVELSAGRLVDPFGGESDLRKRRVRCVGDARARFAEDGLRPLRALRFAATLAFAVESDTGAALAGALDTFRRVAVERKRDELEKLLGRGQRLGAPLRLLRTSGMLGVLAAPLEAAPARVASRLERLAPDAYLRLAAWAVAAGLDRAAAFDLVAGLRASNQERARVASCVDAVARRPAPARAPALRFWTAAVGEEAARDGAAVAAALWPGRDGGLCRQLTRVLRSRPPLRVGDLAVDGDDMLALGLRGREVGETLAALLRRVLERPSRNRREVLLDLAHKLSTAPRRVRDPCT